MFFPDKGFYGVLILLITLLISACSEMSDENMPVENQPSLQELANLTVYKDPTCGCCGKWVEHVQHNGFTAQIHDTSELADIKTQYGISPQFRSCHTAVSTEGFIFEGHVPAKFIHQFLAEKTEGAIGLAVPAMPVGSPGMEVGDKFMPYQVLLIKENGDSEVYADVRSKEEQF